MTTRVQKVFLSICILLLVSTVVFADFENSEIVLEDGIIDLRGINSLPARSGNEPDAAQTPEDLEIGSIFLTVDNHARKVVDIYEHNGRTVIETIEPRPEEVFLALYVPDFEVELGRENIIPSSVADGVTVLPPDAGRSDMYSSDFDVPAEADRSVTWLETHDANDGKDVLTVNVNIPIVGSIVSANDLKKLKELQDEAKEKDRLEQEQEDNPSGTAGTGEEGSEDDTGEDSGKPKTELDFGASGEVWLRGSMRLVEPSFYAGIKRPRLRFSWVSKWWGGYLTIKHEEGYIRGGVESAMQLDMKLTGTLTLSAELKIPLYALMFKKGNTEAIVGLYIKVGLDGTLSLAVEFSEYSWQQIGAKCKLYWPFIPVRLSPEIQHFNNFAYRPILAAEAELKAGLYLGADLDVLGIGLLGAEGGGGAYITAGGYMEPMGIMGYDDNIGSYGDFNDWILELNAEAGVYGEATAEILSINLTLWEQRWPFWEWRKDWEL